MLSYVIPIISSMRPIWSYVLNQYIALAFLSVVPIIMYAIIKK